MIWRCFGDFLIILRLQKQKIKKFKTTKRKKRKKFHVKQVVYSIESVFVKEVHGFLDIALKLQKVNFGVFHVKQTQKNLFHIKERLEIQILAEKSCFLLLFCFFISEHYFSLLKVSRETMRWQKQTMLFFTAEQESFTWNIRQFAWKTGKQTFLCYNFEEKTSFWT